MHVVGHQAISPHRHARLAAALGQYATADVVAVLEEHALPPIAQLGDMVSDAGYDDAGEARHAPVLPAWKFGAMGKVSP